MAVEVVSSFLWLSEYEENRSNQVIDVSVLCLFCYTCHIFILTTWEKKNPVSCLTRSSVCPNTRRHVRSPLYLVVVVVVVVAAAGIIMLCALASCAGRQRCACSHS